MKEATSSRQCLPKQHSKVWDKAIADAENLKAEAEERVRGLNAAIRMFRRHRDADEPWPGTTGEVGEEGIGNSEGATKYPPP